MDSLKSIVALIITLLIFLIFTHFNLSQILRKSDFGLADSEGEQHFSLSENPLHCHPVQPFPWSSV